MAETKSMNFLTSRDLSGLRPLAWLLLLTFLPSAAQAEWHKYMDTAMTTPVELEFWFSDQSAADAIAKDVLAASATFMIIGSTSSHQKKISGRGLAMSIIWILFWTRRSTRFFIARKACWLIWVVLPKATQ